MAIVTIAQLKSYFTRLFKPTQQQYADLIDTLGPGTPYRRYVALLTQTSTNAPVVTVLEDTLGVTPVWNRQSAGEYRFTLTGAFPAAKTFVFVGPLAVAFPDITYGVYANRASDNFITVITYALSAGSTGVDGRLSGTPIEIRIYP